LAEPLQFESWQLNWRHLSLPVWDIVGGDRRGPMIIMTHGWGESRVKSLSRISTVAPYAARIIAWDLPGHGDARGICSLGTAEVDALLSLMDAMVGDGKQRVVLMGWSLGAGVSIAASAARADIVLGVIAEAPYRVPPTPARNVLRMMRMPYRTTLSPAMWMLGMRLAWSPTWNGRNGRPGFDRVEHASRLDCPLLVIHGERDEVCPVDDGREIAAAAPHGRLMLVADGGHQTLWEDEATRAKCEREVAAVLALIGKRSDRSADDADSVTSRLDARPS
jgi:pimeloyl-ACP methyl ester carboxylesterase